MFKYKYKYIYIIFLIFLLFLFLKLFNFKEYKNVNLELIKTDFSKLPGWNENLRAEVIKSFINSCNVIKKAEYDAKIFIASKTFSLKPYKSFCKELELIKNKKDLKKLIENYFDPYFFKNEEAKITGYIELTLKGRKIKNESIAPNAVPILKKPNELLSIDLNLFNKSFEGVKLKGILKNKEIIPFPSRKEIEAFNLFEEDILAYIDDPAQAYFLHVQGSGKILISDEEVMYVGYADNNGQNYTSIGKILIDSGEILQEDISMQSIQSWMKNNPIKANEIMHLNERYIFFKERKNKNVFGSSQTILEPMHSLAIDNNYISFHVPVWININSYKKENFIYTGLFIAQDTGAAIKGPSRYDLFLGHGKEKEEIAGSLNSKGKAWFLIPKEMKR